MCFSLILEYHYIFRVLSEKYVYFTLPSLRTY